MAKLKLLEMEAKTKISESLAKDLGNLISVKGISEQMQKELQRSYQAANALVAHLSKLVVLLKKIKHD